jgi:hypothetical protein
MAKKNEITHASDHKTEIIRLIKEAAYSHDTYKVFNDFLEMSAISISNQVDFTHREEREKRYLDLINSYEKKQQQLFPEMFAHLVEALEEHAQTTGPEDVLGRVFHGLDLHNKYKGQFFTPQHISDMMALCVCGDEHQKAIEDKGFISMCEPTCGSGVMVTSMCKAMKTEKLNYCSQLVVTAVDVDLKCVHMTYLQLALYGVPAVVIHGNSLTMEEWTRWYTPVYIANGWVWRSRCGLRDTRYVEDEMIKCALEPSYAALRQVEALIADSAEISEVAEIVEIAKIDEIVEIDRNIEPAIPVIPLVPAQTYSARRKRTEDNSNQISLFEMASLL